MNQFKILFAIFISSLFMSNVYAVSIENIQAVDNQTVKIAASSDVTFSDIKVYGDVKVLKDINVLNANKDSQNTKKIVLTLASDLFVNSSYSLIWVLWAEWSIEFNLGDKLSWEFINENFYNETKIIEKVVILDPRTIEVYYNYDITELLFEFKLLSELVVESLYSAWNNILDVNLSSILDKSSLYILMIWSLENIDGEQLDLMESLYDFSTNSTLVEKNPIVQEEILESTVIEETQIDSNIEEVSLNAAITPETWAETWFVILLTFLFSTFYFIKNKAKKV